jgi:predicted hotdog family 3-hydroxylacyl-ACP dehydratase
LPVEAATSRAPLRDLEALLPHAGDMVLIDSVDAWNEKIIVCSSASHRRPHNPLRNAGRLSTFAAIEYAAQAMALHGALMAERTVQSGLLVSVRDFVLCAERLDDTSGELCVRATTIRRDRRGGIYTFEVEVEGRVLAAGQVGAILTPAARNVPAA